jgi:DNA-binding LytR/AlgR family response regulator
MTMLLVICKWASHFYKKWKISEVNLIESNSKFEELRYKSRNTTKSLKFQKRNRDYIISVEEVRLVKSEFGVVKVYMKDGDSYIFQDTLSKIASQLPENRFFQLTRNLVAHHTKIESMESSTYGKVLVKLKDVNLEEPEISVSRLKASKFRKWYNSILSSNL